MAVRRFSFLFPSSSSSSSFFFLSSTIIRIIYGRTVIFATRFIAICVHCSALISISPRNRSAEAYAYVSRRPIMLHIKIRLANYTIPY